uniref:Retrotransposon gag domain-containing protein n=1 Tax=Trichobilharzia regenti TaxID=157069 RepID=A0AA85IUD7_TRIRE|nr:unnamed protein product [Trichobilharzia regenti]
MASLPNSRKQKREMKNSESPANASACDSENGNRAPPVMSSTSPTTSTSTPAPDMIQAMVAAFRIALMTSNTLSSPSNNTPQVKFPAPEKFVPGESFTLWEEQCRRYIQQFDEKQRASAVICLLSIPALKRLKLAGVDTEETMEVEELFAAMRRAFAPHTHVLGQRAAFHACVQQSGESTEEFLWRLQELAPVAFEGDSATEISSRILHQFEEGLLHDEVRERVIESNPTSPVEALQVAKQKEALIKLRKNRRPTDGPYTQSQYQESRTPREHRTKPHLEWRSRSSPKARQIPHQPRPRAAWINSRLPEEIGTISRRGDRTTEVAGDSFLEPRGSCSNSNSRGGANSKTGGC